MAQTLEERRAGNRAAKKRYRARHPERVREQRRESYGRHRERALVRGREYAHEVRIANPEKIRIRRAIWYAKHRDSHRKTVAAWQRANPELRVAGRERRRALANGAYGSHTAAQWREKVILHSGCCIYCGEQKLLTKDHALPLTRGGTDYIDNILPACVSCNSSKGRKTASEFIAYRAVA